MTTNEAANILGVTPSRVLQYIYDEQHKGKKFKRIGNRYYLTKKQVESFKKKRNRKPYTQVKEVPGGITVKEAAGILGVTPERVGHYIREAQSEGEQFTRINKRYYLSPEQVEAFKKRRVWGQPSKSIQNSPDPEARRKYWREKQQEWRARNKKEG